MTHEPNDADFVSRFAALRDEDAGGAYPFRLPPRRPTPAQAPLRWATAGSLAAAALAMLWIADLRNDARSARLAAYLTATAWRGPTDFLLQTPGWELLSAVPAIGMPDVGTVPGPTRRAGTDTARLHRRDQP